MPSRTCCLTIAAALLLTLPHVSEARSRKIDAVHGKQYKLTKRHGPWMIMVANFREPPPEARTEGMTPKEAADELVFELRSKGIPAYLFSKDDVEAEIETSDRQGRSRRRYYTALQGGVSVLAGNYANADDRLAQKTLAYVKKFHPKFLRGAEKKGQLLHKLKNGGVYRTTPGRPGPLSGAFLTINPILSPQQVSASKNNPLLLALNSSTDYSLLENPGTHTLVVASFSGKSVTQVGSSKFEKIAKTFKISSTLDDAAMSAWELTKSLREMKGIEAYVFHDRHRSVVTVGSFHSPNDPRIAELANMFKAKTKNHPVTHQDVLMAEIFTIPLNPKPGEKIKKSWLFDPQPRVINVPKI